MKIVDAYEDDRNITAIMELLIGQECSAWIDDKCAAKTHCILFCLKGEVYSKVCMSQRGKAITLSRWFDIGKECHRQSFFNVSKRQISVRVLETMSIGETILFYSATY